MRNTRQRLRGKKAKLIMHVLWAILLAWDIYCEYKEIEKGY